MCEWSEVLFIYYLLWALLLLLKNQGIHCEQINLTESM